jgi:hypothetical protein
MKTILSLLALVSFTAATLAENIAVKVVDAGGLPVQKADVVAILKSGAYQDAKLDSTDSCHKCQPTEQCVKIFAAAPGYEAESKKYSGGAGVVTITLKPNAAKGSAVVRRAGPLPGIEGSVNPHLDKKNRTYMHATKIGLEIAGRPAPQPVFFTLNRPIDAVTSTGQKFRITVIDITQEASLLEFTVPK